MRGPAIIAAAAAAAALAAPGVARAGGEALACQLAEPGSIDVDGMLDDWQGVARGRMGGATRDASFDVRCLFDGARLALSVDVRDDQLSRRTKAHKRLLGDDRLVITLSAGGKPLTLTLFPGAGRVPPRRTVDGKAAPKWLAVEDTAQPRGWSVELELPAAKIPGWSDARPTIEATVTFEDADELDEEATPLAKTFALGLGERAQLLDRFLAQVRLSKQDVRLDQPADVDRGAPGPERVVAAGTVLGLLAGDGFGYLELPVARARDVLAVELADLRGDGSRVVLTVLRQHGGGGSRDVVIAWGAEGGRYEQLLAVEVRKEAAGNRLESAWSLADRKVKGKARGKELVVRAGAAVGWDEDTFEEVPAPDAEPIHVPWDAARAGTAYWLDGDTLRSRPLDPPKPSGAKKATRR